MTRKEKRVDKLTVGVLHGDDLLVVIQVVQEGSEDAPAGIQLVVTNEVGVVALEGIQNQGFVGLGDLEVGEATAVGQVQLGDHRLHGETGQLGVHLDIDGLVGLNTDDKLVTGDVLEDTGSDVLELDADLGLLLVQGLSGLENEGNAVPTLVLNVCNHRAESRATRLLGHSVVLQVAGLAAVEGAAVLADDNVLGLNSIHSAENTDLLITDILGREGNGTLHGEQCEDLQKVYKIVSMFPTSSECN
jgi:hypothetical protein